MLKKVICLLLVLACSVALFACSGSESANTNTSGNNTEEPGDNSNVTPPTEDPEENTSGDKELIDSNTTVDTYKDQAFFALVKNSRPNVITTRVTVTSSKLGNCEGYYRTTVLDEDDYVFYYQYEKFNKIGEGSLKETVGPHTIYYKDGQYSLDSEDNWVYAHPDPDVINVKFDLDKQYLGSYTLSSDGTRLEAKVSAANAAKILGVEITATSSVKLTVESDGTHLWKVAVEYTNNQDSVYIETSYTYENVSKSAE